MKSLLVCLVALFICTASHAQTSCTNKDYAIYQRYDALLEANPNISTSELRSRFSRQSGIAAPALKDLHMRCSARWANEKPGEAAEYAKKGIEDMKKDCANRPANDAACKAVKSK